MSDSAERNMTALDDFVMAFVRIGRDMSVPIPVRNFATNCRDRLQEYILASSERREPLGGQVDPELERVEIGDYLLSKGQTMPDDDYCMFEAGWLAARIHRAEAASVSEPANSTKKTVGATVNARKNEDPLPLISANSLTEIHGVPGDEHLAGTASILVISIARELYDRFMMGGWEPRDAYPLIRAMLDAHMASVSPVGPEPTKKEKV